MGKFVRELSPALINRLKNEPLFEKKLKPDMLHKKAVFPAIRNGNMEFYFAGGGLFNYSEGGFKTHIKYATIPAADQRSYVAETDLHSIRIIDSFADSYESIKERCKVYGGIEAEYVSQLYQYSGLSSSEVVLLDTEIALYDDNDKSRIDLLFYDTAEKQLCFCEAKHFTNGEIWAKEGEKPAVVNQIRRYNDKIASEGTTILAQYERYIDLFNSIFGTNLPKPETIYPKTGLLVFGYDNDQKNKINRLLVEDGSLENINYYTVGNTKNTNPRTIYKALVKE